MKKTSVMFLLPLSSFLLPLSSFQIPNFCFTLPFALPTGLPDPFAKITVEGTRQEYTTEICKASLDPRWNSYYDLFLGKNDNIIIAIYNQRKMHKRQGFLGCVRIAASSIQLLRDTGCKSSRVFQHSSVENQRSDGLRASIFHPKRK